MSKPPLRLTPRILCRLAIRLGFLAVGPLVWGQGEFTGYLEPAINLNYSLGKGFSQNVSAGHRMYYSRNGAAELRVRQVDLALFTSVAFLGNQSVGLGIQYRFRKPFEPDRTNEIRLTQQYNRTFRPRVIRIGHRLRSEQRIFPDQTVHRFRYRLAFDGPLQGERTDVGEWYWVGTLEQLLSVSRSQSAEWDVRAGAELGYLAADGVRTELGTEYRREDFTHTGGHELFFTMTLVLSL